MKLENLKEHIQSIYNITFESMELLREGGSKAYVLRQDEKHYILKIVPNAFKKTVLSALDILMYLETFEFPSPRVVLSKKGDTYEVFNDDTIMVLYHYIDGQEPGDDLEYDRLGELVGRLHQLMSDYPGTLVKLDKHFYIDRYMDLMRKKQYPANKIDQFKAYGDELWTKVKAMPRGFCHGDLHRGNILEDKKGDYHILDFDTACIGFPVYDMMVLCNATDFFHYDSSDFEETKRRYETFLKGYGKWYALDSETIESFYYFIGIYHFQLQATIIEIYGLDCVGEEFLDQQLSWLMQWKAQSEAYLNVKGE